MLVSFESLSSEFSMQVMTRADYDKVYFRRVQHFVRARNSVRKAKSLSYIVRRDSGSCGYRSKLDAFGFEVRQQHGWDITTGTDHSHHDRFFCPSDDWRSAEHNFARNLCFRIVV